MSAHKQKYEEQIQTTNQAHREYLMVRSDYKIALKELESLRAEKAEMIFLASKLKEAIDEVLEVLDGNGVPNIGWVKNCLLNQSITLAKYEK
jgi:hypothetical protein